MRGVDVGIRSCVSSVPGRLQRLQVDDRAAEDFQEAEAE